MLNLAFSSKHPFVPNPKKDPLSCRWIASISDGSTVFEDVSPGIESAWRRLSLYLQIHNLKLTNLRLEAFGKCINLVPYKDENDNPQINGYWHSKKLASLLNASEHSEIIWYGIGFVKAREIHITWVDHGGNVSHEIRVYKESDPAIIINDAV